jgi:TonB family protein
MSTMVQIVSSPEEYEEFEEEIEPEAQTSNQRLKRKVQKKPLKIKKPLKTLSRQGPTVEELEYAQKLQVFIEENRFYPRPALRLKQQGTVVISLTILNDGSFADVKLNQKSKYAILDKAAVSFLKDLKKFKPLPDSKKVKQEYIIPIFYKIGR